MTNLLEALAPLIPKYPIEIAGHHLELRLDVNINKTKKGVKLQFIIGKSAPEDPRKLQDLSNEIGTELQKKFGNAGLQIIADLENPYSNVIGFLLPLPSLANYLMKHVFEISKEQPTDQDAQQDSEEEPILEPLPAEEMPPSEEDQDLKEVMMWRAGLTDIVKKK